MGSLEVRNENLTRIYESEESLDQIEELNMLIRKELRKLINIAKLICLINNLKKISVLMALHLTKMVRRMLKNNLIFNMKNKING